ncbi:MAG TPA: amidohydrolase, partial [Planctomycetota bacterium]
MLPNRFPARGATCFAALVLAAAALPAQQDWPDAPDRGEGEGPFPMLVLRGATLVDGTGAPARGPVDVVIEGDRIRRIVNVGNPGLPIDAAQRPQLAPGGRELDCSGLYLLPGFIDMHGHIGGREQGAGAEYVFKLWLAHGI